jgi:hypothetical protein
MTAEGCQREENFNDCRAAFFVEQRLPVFLAALNLVRRELERTVGEINRISHRAIDREGANM